MQVKRMDKYRKVALKAYFNAPENKEILKAYRKANKNDEQEEGKRLLDSADLVINPQLEVYKYTEEQINTYTTIGGTPFLDYEYTVFGEMIEGFDVLDSISLVQTDKYNRPMSDVVMSIKVVKK
jgi:hypothetical protein